MSSSSGEKQFKTVHCSPEQTSTSRTTRNRGSKVVSASRSVKAPRASTKISEKTPDENAKNPFGALSQHMNCFPELDAEMLKLPVNKDSALNRLAGKLKPGDVPSSVPVRKRLTCGKSKASGKGSLEAKKQISPSKAYQQPAQRVQQRPSLCIIPMKMDQPGTELLADQKADRMHQKSSHPPSTTLSEISIENEQEMPQTEIAEADSDQEEAAGTNELTPPSFLKLGQPLCFLPANQPASRNALPVYIQTVLPSQILMLESGHVTNETETALAFDSSQPQESIPRQVLESADQPLYMVINPTAPMVCASFPAQSIHIVPLEQQVMFFPGEMPTQAIGPQKLSVQMIGSQKIGAHEVSTQVTGSLGRCTEMTCAQGTTLQITGLQGKMNSPERMTSVEEILSQKVNAEGITEQVVGAEGTTRQSAGSETSGTEETSTQLAEAEETFLEIIGPQQVPSHMTSSQIIDFLAESLEMVMPQGMSSQLMSSADSDPQKAPSPSSVQEESAQGRCYYKCV